MNSNREGKLSVLGIGVVSGLGRGLDAHIRTDEGAVSSEEESAGRVCRVSPQTLKDRDVLKGMRRADRFGKMAALAAHDAFVDAGLVLANDDVGLAVIIATAFGPHDTTFAFLDEILDFGDVEVSPILFSHSVHNAAASYVATILGCRGPACTIADFESPLHAGLRTAELWLRAGRCKDALVGYVEETSKPMNYAMATKRTEMGGSSLQPFSFSPCPDVAASEGSVFLALNLTADGQRLIDPQRFTGEKKIADIVSLLRHLGIE